MRNYRTGELVRAAGASFLLLVLLIAPPLLLIGFVGNPLPAGGISLTGSISDSFIIFVLATVCWLMWAQLLLCVVVEILSAVRGTTLPTRLPGTFGVQQHLARQLVTAVLAIAATGSIVGSGTVTAPPASAAMVQATHTISTSEVVAETAVPANEQSTTADESLQSVTVQRGDSLWSLAEKHLGDGDNYTQIIKLNDGQKMVDGTVFNPADPLVPGWTLAMPASAVGLDQIQTATQVKDLEVNVKPGDSLWRIAEEKYGDGNKWPKIWEANRGEHFKDGRTFTNPDLIQPGWKLDVPGKAVTVPAPSGGNTAPSHNGEGTSTAPEQGTAQQDLQQAPAAQSEGQDQAQSRTTASQQSAEADMVEDQGIPIRTIGGVGALLAAGVIGLLVAKRRRQQQHRKPSQTIPIPEGPPAELEHELRTVADPLSRDCVDKALRILAAECAKTGQPLPVVTAARLTEDRFELFLAGAQELPTPFTATVDPNVWSFDREAASDLMGYALDEIPAPYPGLVIIGHDEEDAHLLLDLEHVGELGISADDSEATSILAAIAVELATSTWADDLQISVVGGLHELAFIDTGRVRHVAHLSLILNELEQRAATDRDALDQAGEDLQQARIRPDIGGDWSPEIVLVAGHVTDEERARLHATVSELPRVAIATVAQGEVDSGWSIKVDGTGAGVLQPFGLSLRPQRIGAEDYEALVAVLHVADVEPEGAGDELIEPAWEDLPGTIVDVDEVPIEELDADTTNDHDDQQDDDQGEEADEEDGHDVDENTAGIAHVHAFIKKSPIVRVFGPVMVDEPAGFDLPAGQVSRATELVAFMALNPGADYIALDKAMSPGKRVTDNARGTRVGKARRWLGATADGEPYLVKHPGAAGYRLHEDVKTDWDLWRELVPHGARAAGTVSLEQAMALVRGAPFSDAKPRYYAWAEHLKLEMTSTIVDAAVELARRRLLEGVWGAAEEVAVLGIRVAPEVEALWRVRITAAAKAGKWAAVEDLIQRLLVIIDDIGGGMDDETADLLAKLDDAKAQHSDTDLLTQVL